MTNVSFKKNIEPKKRLQKILTRFYYPITIQSWFNGATRELEKVIGVGFSNVIMKFDSKKLEVFRIAKELHTKIKTAMLHYATTKKFSNGLENYKKLVKEYDRVLSERNNIWEANKRFEILYPIFAVSYFVSNLWADELPSTKKDNVIKLCLEYRKVSEGILNRLDQFVFNFLKKHKLSHFAILDIEKKEINMKLAEQLKSGYVFSKGKFYIISWADFLHRNSFFYEEKIASNDSISSIQGFTAFPGKIKGIVKIVFSPFDFKKIKTGDILVSPMTQVTFIPVLSKVAGIITDEGGITSHAAIVARELKKPCIIGTKIATQVLSDGDIVELDANNSIIRLLKKK